MECGGTEKGKEWEMDLLCKTRKDSFSKIFLNLKKKSKRKNIQNFPGRHADIALVSKELS